MGEFIAAVLVIAGSTFPGSKQDLRSTPAYAECMQQYQGHRVADMAAFHRRDELCAIIAVIDPTIEI